MRYFSLLLVLLITGAIVFSCSKPALTSNQSDVIYVRNEGADMPAYVYGNAASKVFVVLVHGGPGGNGLEYRAGQYVEDLERDYAMVYWDQRGQGMSHGNYGAAKVTIQTMADDLYVLVKSIKEHYGEDIKLFLLGHSWGGMLGTAFMVHEDYQMEIDGWIESNGAHDIPLLNKSAIQMFQTIAADEIAAGNNVDRWTEILDFANGVDTSNISLEEGGQINQYGFEAEGLLEQVTEGSISSDQSILEYLFFSATNPLTSFIIGGNTSYLLEEEVESTSLTNQLSKIEQPTLLIWGQYDFVVPPALATSAYQRIQSSDKELVILANSGHSPMDNQPTAYVAAIKQFIERNR